MGATYPINPNIIDLTKVNNKRSRTDIYKSTTVQKERGSEGENSALLGWKFTSDIRANILHAASANPTWRFP